ncbi:hypothetical protein RRG08_033492 [Elysia crispata]|uniref:Uncharacterized protein n=1 Tax=Elysia crispata TaxID=231223 RepID=A0AAE1AV18_9GAST|nr:hypothetical protein RRG08_033492 [Elysia crispata]
MDSNGALRTGRAEMCCAHSCVIVPSLAEAVSSADGRDFGSSEDGAVSSVELRSKSAWDHQQQGLDVTGSLYKT